MKKLITVADIKKYAEAKKDAIYIGSKTIITPAAKDVAQEYNIQFIEFEENEQVMETEKYSRDQIESIIRNSNNEQLSANINPDLINKIVAEVMANLKKRKEPPELVKEVDPNGLRLVRGDSVYLETFKTGNPEDKIKIRELFSLKESPNMSTGFMELENTAFEWNFKGDEIYYIIQGTLECTINGNRYSGRTGDVLYVPANSKVKLFAPEKVKYFYVTYPAGYKR